VIPCLDPGLPGLVWNVRLVERFTAAHYKLAVIDLNLVPGSKLMSPTRVRSPGRHNRKVVGLSRCESFGPLS